MLLRPFSCALALSLLCACASISETATTGDNTYRVTYNAGGKWQTWVEVKNIARKQAEDHCESLGQRLSQPKVTSNHATGLMPKEATVDFTCVDKPAPKANSPTGS
ncbi:hypothetical protein [Bordetella sp. BOR01]|uniref:hypothetical protein n=1 Tax=Bordetella sp. BOR01 TaxID=2854779 RepID=UPI001C450B6B|nr:hypothetical protein [Bordetella sp. BOR01]MBV7482444.1 hypothetical protein [Bordetella sp. BOR01]